MNYAYTGAASDNHGIINIKDGIDLKPIATVNAVPHKLDPRELAFLKMVRIISQPHEKSKFKDIDDEVTYKAKQTTFIKMVIMALTLPVDNQKIPENCPFALKSDLSYLDDIRAAGIISKEEANKAILAQKGTYTPCFKIFKDDGSSNLRPFLEVRTSDEHKNKLDLAIRSAIIEFTEFENNLPPTRPAPGIGPQEGPDPGK